MKGRPIDQIVYEHLYPRPKPNDPQNFHAVLTRSLIYEVRQEVHSFYGHLDSQEAKYPGLDYCNPTHRIRLCRWPWHRRLFRAFDALRLTPSEIAGLTKWEGTKWAKDRYEKEHGVIIPDTADEGIPTWGEVVYSRSQSQSPPEFKREDTPTAASEHERGQEQGEDDPMVSADDEEEESDEDEVLQSRGLELNARLRERVAAHHAGDTSQPLDEDWEQWLKNAIETGEFPMVAEQISRLSTQPTPMTPEEIFPPRILGAAREGNWHEIPEFLHPMLRLSLDTERSTRGQSQSQTGAQMQTPTTSASTQWAPLAVAGTASTADAGSASWRRMYSDLRLPGGGSGNSTASSDRPRIRAGQMPGS